MKRYYELLDDVRIPMRWHLGEVSLRDGPEPHLRSGRRFESLETPTIPVTDEGRILDFCLTSFAVPVATGLLAEAIVSIAGADVQCVPVGIVGTRGMVVLNVLRVVHCVDEARSEFLKWTMNDHRSDLAGQYRQISKLVLDAGALPSDAHFFRIESWLVGLVVSSDLKDAMESVGCVGAKFKELRVSAPRAEN